LRKTFKSVALVGGGAVEGCSDKIRYAQLKLNLENQIVFGGFLEIKINVNVSKAITELDWALHKKANVKTEDVC
jgi:hypothetical protein